MPRKRSKKARKARKAKSAELLNAKKKVATTSSLLQRLKEAHNKVLQMADDLCRSKQHFVVRHSGKKSGRKSARHLLNKRRNNRSNQEKITGQETRLMSEISSFYGVLEDINVKFDTLTFSVIELIVAVTMYRLFNAPTEDGDLDNALGIVSSSKVYDEFMRWPNKFKNKLLELDACCCPDIVDLGDERKDDDSVSVCILSFSQFQSWARDIGQTIYQGIAAACDEWQYHIFGPGDAAVANSIALSLSTIDIERLKSDQAKEWLDETRDQYARFMTAAAKIAFVVTYCRSNNGNLGDFAVDLISRITDYTSHLIPMFTNIKLGKSYSMVRLKKANALITNQQYAGRSLMDDVNTFIDEVNPKSSRLTAFKNLEKVSMAPDAKANKLLLKASETIDDALTRKQKILIEISNKVMEELLNQFESAVDMPLKKLAAFKPVIPSDGGHDEDDESYDAESDQMNLHNSNVKRFHGGIYELLEKHYADHCRFDAIVAYYDYEYDNDIPLPNIFYEGSDDQGMAIVLQALRHYYRSREIYDVFDPEKVHQAIGECSDGLYKVSEIPYVDVRSEFETIFKYTIGDYINFFEKKKAQAQKVIDQRQKFLARMGGKMPRSKTGRLSKHSRRFKAAKEYLLRSRLQQKPLHVKQFHYDSSGHIVDADKQIVYARNLPVMSAIISLFVNFAMALKSNPKFNFISNIIVIGSLANPSYWHTAKKPHDIDVQFMLDSDVDTSVVEDAVNEFNHFLDQSNVTRSDIRRIPLTRPSEYAYFLLLATRIYDVPIDLRFVKLRSSVACMSDFLALNAQMSLIQSSCCVFDLVGKKLYLPGHYYQFTFFDGVEYHQLNMVKKKYIAFQYMKHCYRRGLSYADMSSVDKRMLQYFFASFSDVDTCVPFVLMLKQRGRYDKNLVTFFFENVFTPYVHTMPEHVQLAMKKKLDDIENRMVKIDIHDYALVKHDHASSDEEKNVPELTKTASHATSVDSENALMASATTEALDNEPLPVDTRGIGDDQYATQSASSDGDSEHKGHVADDISFAESGYADSDSSELTITDSVAFELTKTRVLKTMTSFFQDNNCDIEQPYICEHGIVPMHCQTDSVAFVVVLSSDGVDADMKQFFSEKAIQIMAIDPVRDWPSDPAEQQVFLSRYYQRLCSQSMAEEMGAETTGETAALTPAVALVTLGLLSKPERPYDAQEDSCAQVSSVRFHA